MSYSDVSEAGSAPAGDVGSLVPLVDVINLSEKTGIVAIACEPSPTEKADATLDLKLTDSTTAPTFVVELDPGSDDSSSVTTCETPSLGCKTTLELEEESEVQPPPQEVQPAENDVTLPSECPPGLEKPTAATDSQHPPTDEPQSPSPTEEPSPEITTAPKPHEDAPTTTLENIALEGDPALYSLEGLDPFEAFIPAALLPDELVVHDLDNITSLCSTDAAPRVSAKYVRKLPKPDPGSDAPRRVAHLYLRRENAIGSGHHGAVFGAALKLCLDADSQEQSTVRVAAKTAFGTCGAHWMLCREARMYALFPRRLMGAAAEHTDDPQNPSVDTEELADAENKVELRSTPEGLGQEQVASTAPSVHEDPPVEPAPQTEVLSPADPVAVAECASDACDSKGAEETPERRLLPPIVPKFYGYYKSVEEDFEHMSEMHPGCDEDSDCRVSWPTRILLLEECGKPVSPSRFTRSQRSEIVDMLKRLHDEGFMQGSAYVRNFLVQPGPLNSPRAERSLDEPSFRIIDFGRGESNEGSGARSTRLFNRNYTGDVQRALDELDLW